MATTKYGPRGRNPQKRTYVLPAAVLAVLDAAKASTGRSHSWLIADAILAVYGPAGLTLTHDASEHTKAS